MQPYETIATVEQHGGIHVTSVPFTPGTRVEVVISPTKNGAELLGSADQDRALQLLNALDQSRNTETVGPLRRAELYDRDILH